MLAKVLTKRRFKRIKKLLKSYETSIYEHITSQIFKQKRFTAHYLCKPLFLLVRPARFELATYGFVVRRSVRAELRAHGNLIEICIINKL